MNSEGRGVATAGVLGRWGIWDAGGVVTKSGETWEYQWGELGL